MAKGLAKNYTFSVASKTITLSGITTVRLDKLALITNTTTNKILYNFADSTVSTATVATNVITLSVLQGGESDSDKLRIDYDIESSDTAAFSDTTQPVSAAALPLPTGAATAAKQLADGHNVVVTSAPTTAVTGTFFQGTQPVSAAALPLPAGAATEAKQDTGNTSVGSIDTKTPVLGQALAAASTPVVLTAAQVTTLTPPAAISGFATETTLASIKDAAGIKKITDALPAGTNLLGKTGIDQVTANANEVVTKTGSVAATTFTTATATGDTTLQSAVSATANGSSLAVTGYGTALLQVSGTFSATVTFEASSDAGTTWVNISATQIGGDIVLSATAIGSYRITCTGFDSVRARVSSYTSGAVTVVGRATNGTTSGKIIKLATGTNTIGALTANQSVNLSQLAGNTISSGVGATGTGTIRVVQANDAGKTIQSKASIASSSGDNTIINAGTNKLKIKAFSLTTTSTTAVTCIFKSSTTVLWQVVLQAPTGVSVGANLVVPAPDYIFSTASATPLTLNLSSAQTIHYSVSYIDEA